MPPLGTHSLERGKVDERSLVYALALKGLPGLGDRGFKLLVDFYGSAGAALAARGSEWTKVLPEWPRLAGIIVTEPDYEGAAKDLSEARKDGGWVKFYGGHGYPKLLNHIFDPPAVLYGRGQEDLDQPSVGVVGSRRATTHGLKTAHKIAEGLSRAGLAVVSGLAEGIDTQAHRGALDGGGKTVAVLGSALDFIYPASNRKLFGEILQMCGTVLSEHRPGTPPDPGFFPKRNRIISGLSLGVVVVEAARKSGSLITARCALEQGREVFAVPGMAGASSALGANNLLRQGAALAENAEDVLSVLGFTKEAGESPHGQDSEAVEAEPEGIMAVLEAMPQDIDTIAARAGLTASEAGAKLMELVLNNDAESWPGNRFSLAVK